MSAPANSARSRVAELEAALAEANRALRDQRLSDEEESANFAKALARVAQSERALSQAKAKLVHAETRAEAAEAREQALAAELRTAQAAAAAELAAARATADNLAIELKELRGLAESLSRDSSASIEECAKLAESTRDAETREQQALAAARAARAEQAAAQAELERLRSEASELHTEWTELSLRHAERGEQLARLEGSLEATSTHNATLQKALIISQDELTAVEERLSALTHERTRLLDVLASLDVLGREIAHLTSQATAEGPSLPKVETWLGRDVEAEHVRATLRPEGMSAPPAPPPKATRAWSSPEIVVEGVKLES